MINQVKFGLGIQINKQSPINDIIKVHLQRELVEAYKKPHYDGLSMPFVMLSNGGSALLTPDTFVLRQAIGKVAEDVRHGDAAFIYRSKADREKAVKDLYHLQRRIEEHSLFQLG